MVDIIHRVATTAPLSKVYAALSTVKGVSGWWTEETAGDFKLGGTITVRFRSLSGEEIGGMQFEPVKLDPDRAVHWRFTSGPPEWLGTEVTFSLSRAGDRTIILFAHKNWREVVEFTAHCSTKWATFLLSLRDYVESGRGKPSPHDLKIDDWN
jgi:uncharacterized protein YndB with AHSA1/START domain